MSDNTTEVDRWDPHYSATMEYAPGDGDYVKYEAYAALQAENEALRQAQHYTYIGKDGKPRLARDMEDEIERLKADRAQAAQVRKEALEEAAIVAQSQWERWNDMSGVVCDVTACQNVAAAIRALIEKEDG